MHNSNPDLVTIQPVTCVMEDLNQTEKVTLIYDVNGQKERVVIVYNEETGQATIIQDVKIDG